MEERALAAECRRTEWIAPIEVGMSWVAVHTPATSLHLLQVACAPSSTRMWLSAHGYVQHDDGHELSLLYGLALSAVLVACLPWHNLFVVAGREAAAENRSTEKMPMQLMLCRILCKMLGCHFQPTRSST